MIKINSYIRFDIEALTPETSIADVMIKFASTTCTHLPVVENNFLIGNISEDDIQAFDSSKKVGDYRYALDTFFVRKETNWLDVLETFARHNANLVPVLDDANEYAGYYELIDIITIFNDTPFLYEPGGVVIVEKGMKDYSFSEISQIVESNEGKLLGAFISDSKDDIIQITLKVGNTGLNSILQTLRRYNYNIIVGNEDDMYMEGLKERSNYLKKFLNI
ncbi:CBS domain-containing protein [Ascidiimonas sp. W6]|uniref:CBS domain-containing protein n=1 Tax=Ascidiimonas meishanensis TaxID=3128903 RepID=UPI0030EC5441